MNLPRLTLTQRLSLVFAALLLACCGASAWLQIRASDLHDKETIQGLSRDLATHIARNSELMDAAGPRPDALRHLFSQLMAVNPSVEVYLLDAQGHIRADDAPPGHVIRDSVDLRPVRRFIAGDALPILGDDPRSNSARKVFSAAPLRDAAGAPSGYVYVVLLGEAHDALSAQLAGSTVLRTTLWSMALVAALGLVAGLVAFRSITRPLKKLTDAVSRFDASREPAETGAQSVDEPLPFASEPAFTKPEPGDTAPSRDEIAILERAFAQMAARIRQQWRELTRQDQERRDLIANISHDLRTPLMSLHGYLETLELKGETLAPQERRRYLGIALSQSTKVGRLAQSLFELARLEHGHVQPERERFSLVDLLQDVFQKFELAAEAKRIELRAAIPSRVPAVVADLGMIERVLTNLLDNAIRHTPEGGVVEVALMSDDTSVAVTVCDTGAGLPPEIRATLFQRAFGVGRSGRIGGLGLLITQRMLQLNGSQIELIERAGFGGCFAFALPTNHA